MTPIIDLVTPAEKSGAHRRAAIQSGRSEMPAGRPDPLAGFAQAPFGLLIRPVRGPQLSTGTGQKSREIDGDGRPQPVDEPVETVDSPALLTVRERASWSLGQWSADSTPCQHERHGRSRGRASADRRCSPDVRRVRRSCSRHPASSTFDGGRCRPSCGHRRRRYGRNVSGRR